MLDRAIEVDDNLIDSKSSPFIIAEVGSNFNQNLDTAKQLIKIASESKADAVKFQLFNSEALYPQKDGLYNIFKSIELNPNWIQELKSFADDLNITFMASCFDKESVDVIEQSNVLAHKIASSETTNLELLAYIASKNKPMFISTGMCTIQDIDNVVEIFKNENCKFELMHCVSTYPAKTQDLNLQTINSLKQRYKCKVGYSGHENGVVVSSSAVLYGINSLERHITLDRTMYGSDQSASIEYNGMINLVHNIKKIMIARGEEKLGHVSPEELIVANKLRSHIKK